MSTKVGGAGDVPVARVESKQDESVQNEPAQNERVQEPSKSNDNPDVQAIVEGQSDFQYKAANDNRVELTGAGRTDPARSVRDAETDYAHFRQMTDINANQPRDSQYGSTWMGRSEMNNGVFASRLALRADDPAYLASMVRQLKDRPPPDNTVSLTTLSRLEGPQRQAVVTGLRAAYEQGKLTDQDIYGPAGRPTNPNDPVAVMWNEARRGAAPPASGDSKQALDLVSGLKDLGTVGTSLADAVLPKLGLATEHISQATSGFTSFGNGAIQVADALMRLPGATAEQRRDLLVQLSKGVVEIGVGLETLRDLETKSPGLSTAMRASGLGNVLDGTLTFFKPHSTAEGVEGMAKLALGLLQVTPIPGVQTAAKFMDFGMAATKLAGGFEWMGGLIERDFPKLGEELRRSFI